MSGARGREAGRLGRGEGEHLRRHRRSRRRRAAVAQTSTAGALEKLDEGRGMREWGEGAGNLGGETERFGEWRGRNGEDDEPAASMGHWATGLVISPTQFWRPGPISSGLSGSAMNCTYSVYLFIFKNVAQKKNYIPKKTKIFLFI